MEEVASIADTMINLCFKVVGYGASIVGMTVLWVYFKQDSMLYHPNAPTAEYRYSENNPETYRHPGERDMKYDDVRIKTEDGEELAGWFIKQKSSPEIRDTILFFHGNAGNIGGRLFNIELLYK